MFSLQRLARPLALTALVGMTIPALATTNRDESKALKLAAGATSFAQLVLGNPNPDDGISPKLKRHAKCIATFRNVMSAGFFFGAKLGDGLVSCRTAQGWGDPIFLRIAGGSWGFQFGAQKADVIMVFTGDAAQKLISGMRLQLGVDASIAAGPVGRSGDVSTDVGRGTGIYSYARTKGAFAGIALSGSSLSPLEKYNNLFYQDSDLLTVTRSMGRAPSALRQYSDTLGQYLR